MKYFILKKFLFLSLLGMIAGGLMIETMVHSETLTSYKLPDKKIYFGHQSVGQNILDGISRIVDSPIIVTKLNKYDKNIKSGIYHFRAGENYNPISKIEDFYSTISNSDVKPDISFLKLCYVDINHKTDLDKVFNYYRNSVENLKEKYPDMEIVHFTVPLKTNNENWKTFVKKILKRDVWEYKDNIQRNIYNEMLRAQYQGREPIFDIALIESTHPDGSREFFEYQGEKYATLVRTYTDDGGHLNEVGQDRVASELLNFLIFFITQIGCCYLDCFVRVC